MAKRSVVRFGC